MLLSDGVRRLVGRSPLREGYARQSGVQEQKRVVVVVLVMRVARIGLMAGRLFNGFGID